MLCDPQKDAEQATDQATGLQVMERLPDKYTLRRRRNSMGGENVLA